MTTAAPVRALNATEVGYFREILTADLAHAQTRCDETDSRLYWTARANALEGTLHSLDALCGGEPWPERGAVT
jgi:hypothetical protein